MGVPLEKLARLVDGEISGDPTTMIEGVAGIREARRGDITFLANAKYARLMKNTRASAAVVSKSSDDRFGLPLIRVDSPDQAFAKIVEVFSPPPIEVERGVHPLAFIGRGVSLGQNVSVQALAVVQDGARIGDGTTIYSGAYVGHEVSIGRNCVLYPNVVIRERTRIGNNCIIQGGAVVGSDGFGFSSINGVHYRIPQTGIVEIQDDVEIGANVTIDRARFGTTIVGRGTKIDNLVQIAHNVNVGEHCIIAGQAGIAGSAVIGNGVLIGGQAGIDGHLCIGDGVKIGGKSGVTKGLSAGTCVSGFPAQLKQVELKRQASLRRVPELIETIRKLEERISRLESQAGNNPG